MSTPTPQNESGWPGYRPVTGEPEPSDVASPVQKAALAVAREAQEPSARLAQEIADDDTATPKGHREKWTGVRGVPVLKQLRSHRQRVATDDAAADAKLVEHIEAKLAASLKRDPTPMEVEMAKVYRGLPTEQKAIWQDDAVSGRRPHLVSMFALVPREISGVALEMQSMFRGRLTHGVLSAEDEATIDVVRRRTTYRHRVVNYLDRVIGAHEAASDREVLAAAGLSITRDVSAMSDQQKSEIIRRPGGLQKFQELVSEASRNR